MKKLSVIFALFCVFIAALGADPKDKYPFVQNEIAAIEKDMGSTVVGTLTVKDMENIAGRISIAIQKEDYVRKSAIASMILPGLGQFMNQDIVGGSLFLSADIVILAGTLIGGYFLLPSNVQFNNLDYFNTPLANIKTAWTDNSLISYLPAAGVLVGGMILSEVLRHFSAENAADLAAKNIVDGKVTFEPTFSLFGDRAGFGMPGFGMRMRF
jgi:hypothetical protein